MDKLRKQKKKNKEDSSREETVSVYRCHCPCRVQSVTCQNRKNLQIMGLQFVGTLPGNVCHFRAGFSLAVACCVLSERPKMRRRHIIGTSSHLLGTGCASWVLHFGKQPVVRGVSATGEFKLPGESSTLAPSCMLNFTF